MALAPQLVRQRIAAALSAVNGWSEYAGVPARFSTMASRPINHKHFAVDMPGVDVSADRQKALGLPVVESIVVHWSYLLRASDGRDDYDLALIEEAKLVKAARFATGADGPTCRVIDIQRAILSEGTYLLGTITLTASHTYPLT